MAVKPSVLASAHLRLILRQLRDIAVDGVAHAPGLHLFSHVLEAMDRTRDSALPVLMYHRVDEIRESDGLYPGLVSCTPDEFEAQMEYIARRHRTLSMEELLRVRDRNLHLPRNAIMLTFDDAYTDFGDHAWPILKRLGLLATLFVPTSFPGREAGGFWWDHLFTAISRTQDPEVDSPFGMLSLRSPRDRLVAYALLRGWMLNSDREAAAQFLASTTSRLRQPAGRHAVLPWKRITAMARDGLTVAAHSRTHTRLDRLQPAELEDEIQGSYDDLRRVLGTAPPVFAYPGGHYDKQVLEATRAAGFQVAFTTRRGVNHVGRAKWLELRRINVGRRSTLPLIRAQLALGGIGPLI